MKTKRIEKLSLNKETVASLEIREMSRVQGGLIYTATIFTNKGMHCSNPYQCEN